MTREAEDGIVVEGEIAVDLRPSAVGMLQLRDRQTTLAAVLRLSLMRRHCFQFADGDANRISQDTKAGLETVGKQTEAGEILRW